MENDEKFLRKSIRQALKNSSAKFMAKMSEKNIELTCDKGVRQWNRLSLKGSDTMAGAMKYARTNFRSAV